MMMWMMILLFENSYLREVSAAPTINLQEILLMRNEKQHHQEQMGKPNLSSHSQILVADDYMMIKM